VFSPRGAANHSSGGLTRRLVAASVLLALFVAGGFVLMLLAIGDLRAEDQRARRSQAVAVAANQLERLLLDLETGQRGFILTRQERFLQPWQAARASFPVRARTLVALVSDDPPSAPLARGIVRAERAYIDDYSAPLIEAARRGEGSADSTATAVAGKQRVDALRAQFDRLLGQLQRASATSTARAESATGRASAGAAIGLGGSLVLIVLYVAYLRRAMVLPIRRAATMAERLAGGDLGARLPETDAAEVGTLERAFNVMGRSLQCNRDDLAALAEEQSALRRVATLVARGAPPPEVFAAVAEELARLFPHTVTNVLRYEPDGSGTVVGGWSDDASHITVGANLTLDGEGVAVSVLQTRRPARTDHFDGPLGSVPGAFQRAGIRTGVGSPIVVEGKLWGVAISASAKSDALPPEAEQRVTAFTELAATAIANAQARYELHGIADEQAALRRVAMLVARAAPPGEVFTAVAEEIGRLLPADVTAIGRYDGGPTVTGIGGGGTMHDPGAVGRSASLGGRNVSTIVFETGRPARLDSYAEASGDTAALGHERGVKSSVGVPITVAGRLWGVIVASLTHGGELTVGTERRLAEFTELVATAIANAESQAELTASRARIVATADETRRRIERDLHDGAQQGLVSLALQLRAAQAEVPPSLPGLRADLDEAAAGLSDVMDGLREIARGIHPAILAEGGLAAALRTLVRRATVPVQLDVRTDRRLPEPIEVGAYYVVSEALTNAVKHAHASTVAVEVEAVDRALRVLVRDDGVGGADPRCGSGLVGLKDRVEALGGRISIESPPGAGTSVHAQLPLGSD
jgi:signal transduction histidine kinase/CHASE3 domain sensor protein